MVVEVPCPINKDLTLMKKGAASRSPGSTLSQREGKEVVEGVVEAAQSAKSSLGRGQGLPLESW